VILNSNSRAWNGPSSITNASYSIRSAGGG